MTTIHEAVLRIATWAQTRQQDEEGQGMVEYGLILALVAIVAIAGLEALGPAVNGVLTQVSGSL